MILVIVWSNKELLIRFCKIMIGPKLTLRGVTQINETASRAVFRSIETGPNGHCYTIKLYGNVPGNNVSLNIGPYNKGQY